MRGHTKACKGICTLTSFFVGGTRHSTQAALLSFARQSLIAAALLAWPGEAEAQVVVEAKLDSAGMLIGQRMGMTLEVTADADQTIELPAFDSLQQVGQGIEFVRAEEADTSFLNGKKRIQISRRYYFTAFDSALYLLPEMNVRVDGKDYPSNKTVLKVVTLDIDTLHVDSVFGIKAEMSPPFDWDEWEQVIWLGVVALLLGGLIGYVAYRLKHNKPILRRLRNTKRRPPHRVAIEQIERIKEEKLWQKEDSKEYYIQLTDTLRNYIRDRYGINALEMTSFEILQKLTEVNDEEVLGELRELFQTADLVKFAKYDTLINENDRNLVRTLEYINQTKVEEEPTAPQPEVVVVEEKRSRMAKITLICSLVAVCLVLLGVLAYVCYRVYFLTI